MLKLRVLNILCLAMSWSLRTLWMAKSFQMSLIPIISNTIRTVSLK